MKVNHLLFLFAFFLSGCASMVSSTTWPVTIQSTPSEANLKITDKKGMEIYSGQTPATVKLKSGNGFFKRNKYDLQLQVEGYDTVSLALKPKLNGWYFGNLAFGGVVGMLIIDPITGAMYKFNEKPLVTKLNEKN